MSIQKRNGKWGYDFRYEGKRYKRHVWKTKREATQEEVKVKTDLNNGLNITNNVTFADYYEQWYKVNKSHLSYNTRRGYDSILKWIRLYFKDRLMKNITMLEYQSFLNWYGNEAPNKKNREKPYGHGKTAMIKMNTSIRTCVEYAINEGILQRNFTFKATLNYANESKPEKAKYLELDEYRKLKKELLNNTDQIDFLLYIMLITGGRYSDVCRMTYDHIDELNSTLFLDGSKNDTAPRTVSTPRKEMKEIQKYIRSHPRKINGYIFYGRSNIINVNRLNKRLKEYSELLNIKRITTHALRHTHCSILLHEGIDIFYISKRLGHKDISITQKTYSHMIEVNRDKSEKKALEALEKM